MAYRHQQDDLERDQESVYIDGNDYRALRPAARCRSCNVVTWRVSLATGLRRMARAKHGEGCEQPLGKLDRLHEQGKLGDLMDAASQAMELRAMELPTVTVEGGE